MRTTAERLTVTAVRLTVSGDVLLSTGALMAIAKPSGPGVNFGAGGFFLLGLGVAAAGLLLGMAAALAWLRGRRSDRQPSARCLPWEKHLRRLTAAAIGLSAVGAVVLGAGPLFFRGAPGSGFERDIPVFLAGLCVSGAGLLAGISAALYGWWKRRSAGPGESGAAASRAES